MTPLLSDSGLMWLTFWVTVIGSVATVAALVVAIVLGVRESRAIRRENAVRDLERAEGTERQRRAQAEAVSARLHVDFKAPALKGGHHAWVDVINASALPIYHVQVTTRHPDQPGMSSVVDKAFVPGGETGHVHVPPQPSMKLHDSAVEIMFRDAAGRVWHRHEDGHLHEMTDEELGWNADDRRRRKLPPYEPLRERAVQRLVDADDGRHPAPPS
jgi:hypothetical protein